LDRLSSITLNTDTKPAATFTYDGWTGAWRLELPQDGGETALFIRYRQTIAFRRTSFQVATRLGLSYQYNSSSEMTRNGRPTFELVEAGGYIA